ncbi:MAG: XRE family transcriptional regulator [Dehalococcoidia bacterium]|nr:XRE family transcriptional regulator [Dehalococcoidia bacterium]
MATETKRDLIKEGQQDYQEWRASLVDTPEKKALYEEIAAKSDLWLQLAEARQAAGLTQRQLAKRLGVSQAQVARIEKRGYECYTLNSLRRYVKALGEGFSLEVRVQQLRHEEPFSVTVNP